MLHHLLSPLQIRSLIVPNRLVMPAMGTGLGQVDATVSEANLAFIKRRAQSGAGLIITEITAVHPSGHLADTTLGIWEDRFIPGLASLAETIHAAGAKAAIQLHHSGRENYRLLKAKKAVAPSAIPSYIYSHMGMPRELSPGETEELIGAFGAGAKRAKAAGFDLVELHGAHGYLLMQFLSAHSNRRTDRYGGDFKGRSRFIIECLEESRRQVGPDFPISIRLSGEEGIKNGYTVDDILTIIPDLIKAGADLINVSFGTHGSIDVNIDSPNASAPVEYEAGFKAYLSRRIKEASSVPVISVGRYTDPYQMDESVARGDADMIAVARQHLADPDFLKNALAGNSEDTLECLACNQGCIERLALEQKPIRCAINPQTGQELLRPDLPVKAGRELWVIGGGPAGLTAALEASRLGHKVTLFERESRTGGNVRYAAMAPHKDVYDRCIRTLTAKCRKQGVEIRLGVNVTGSMIEEGKPEALILAVGAQKAVCHVEGVDYDIVCDAWQILDGSVQPKDKVVVVGGALVGLEAADFLREKGVREITVIEALARPPVLPQSAHGQMLYRRLKEYGVQLMFGASLKKIETEAVVVSVNGEEKRLEPIAQVIIAIGLTPGTELKDLLAERNIAHFIVGDAQVPGRIIEATTEGAEAAWSL